MEGTIDCASPSLVQSWPHLFPAISMGGICLIRKWSVEFQIRKEHLNIIILAWKSPVAVCVERSLFPTKRVCLSKRLRRIDRCIRPCDSPNNGPQIRVSLIPRVITLFHFLVMEETNEIFSFHWDGFPILMSMLIDIWVRFQTSSFRNCFQSKYPACAHPNTASPSPPTLEWRQIEWCPVGGGAVPAHHVILSNHAKSARSLCLNPCGIYLQRVSLTGTKFHHTCNAERQNTDLIPFKMYLAHFITEILILSIFVVDTNKYSFRCKLHRSIAQDAWVERAKRKNILYCYFEKVMQIDDLVLLKRKRLYKICSFLWK